MSRTAKRRAKPARPRGRPKKSRASLDEQPKAKISIAVDAADLAWAAAFSKRSQRSLSEVFGEALGMLKHRDDLRGLVELLGGTDDIPEDVKAEVEAEFREVGLVK